jgi:hypothetical protein
MPVSITKIELNSYTKLFAFLRLNSQIFEQLKKSKCIKYKAIPNWNLKNWYTMSIWNDENDINEFYRNGTHLEAMKQAKFFSSKLKSKRINGLEFPNWKKAIEIIESNN